MSKEFWFPEDVWREIKKYFIYSDFNVGDIIYGIPKRNMPHHQHYNNFVSSKYGIVVDKTGQYKEATYYVSVPDFGGDYLVLTHNGLNLFQKKMDAMEKLIMISEFRGWWYPLHKSVFQEIMIETLC